jgi:hypothetical protein
MRTEEEIREAIRQYEATIKLLEKWNKPTRVHKAVIKILKWVLDEDV